MTAAQHRSRLALLVVAVSIVVYVPFAPVRLYDFRAFYCAGRAVLAHADPYREHPLHDCERAASAPGMQHTQADVTVPAPLPGYAIGAFAVLAHVPFALCALGWVLASIAAAVAAARLLATSIGVPSAAAFIVVGLPAAIVAIPLGQVTPFVCLGMAICAGGLRRKRADIACAGALLTALDPAVALALCTALFIGVPATRLGLAAGTVALIAVSLATLGPAANIEYVSTVLHAHAYANVTDRTQFSATHFAWVAGLSRGGALTLGSFWYAVSLAAGVWLTLRARRMYGAVAFAVVPPAFAVFGGLYVHYAQVALALPAFLLVAARASGDAREKNALCAGVFVLAIPWLSLSAFPVFAFATVVLAAIFCRGLERAAIALRLGAACALGLIVFFGVAAAAFTQPVAPVITAVVRGNPLAEMSWQNYLAVRDPHPEPYVVLFQLPTVLAFAGCVWGLTRAAMARGAHSAG